MDRREKLEHCAKEIGELENGPGFVEDLSHLSDEDLRACLLKYPEFEREFIKWEKDEDVRQTRAAMMEDRFYD